MLPGPASAEEAAQKRPCLIRTLKKELGSPRWEMCSEHSKARGESFLDLCERERASLYGGDSSGDRPTAGVEPLPGARHPVGSLESAADSEVVPVLKELTAPPGGQDPAVSVKNNAGGRPERAQRGVQDSLNTCPVKAQGGLPGGGDYRPLVGVDSRKLSKQ